LSIHKNSREAIFHIGVALFKQHSYEDAINYFDRVLKKTSLYAPAWLFKGFCYEEIGNMEQAKIAYNKAISLRPGLIDSVLTPEVE
jgi:tetratricopeptide (TPR) repeat protein